MLDVTYPILWPNVQGCRHTVQITRKKDKFCFIKSMVYEKKKMQKILTSAMLVKEGAAINTTYGVNSDVRRIFNACGSTSNIAIFPSL